MSIEIIDCEEFGELQVGLSALVRNGEIALDERISARGYLNVSLRRGQVVFRADRYVGLIPINDHLAVRVRPRTTISNLSHMLVRSGVAPLAIPDFSRGYVPRFEVGDAVENLYRRSLIAGVDRVLSRGMMKSYNRVENPPLWRGRFLASDTIRRHRSRGVRYQQEFEFHALSVSAVENIALKEALRQLQEWMLRRDRKSADIRTTQRYLSEMRHVPDWSGRIGDLVAEIARRIAVLPPHMNYYRDPLWTAFLLLQSKLPNVTDDGSVSLDSLVVDISKVFEAYVRRALVDRARGRGWNIRDGNLRPSTFFTDAGEYTVHPDIVIADGNTPLAVLDAKYKKDPKESDRYELVSFMDALNVSIGAFISPAQPGDRSKYLGRTASAKELSSLRFDLSVADLEAEAERLFANVVQLIDRTYAYS